MSNITTTFRGRATIEAGSTPTIYNVSAAVANTEYSQALTSGTKKFIIRVRGDATLKLAFDAGQSGTNYITVRGGTVYVEDNINFTGTLYFQTTKATQTVEILEWV